MKLGKRFLLGGYVLVAGLLLIDTQAPPVAYAQKGKQNSPSSKNDPKYLAIFRDVVTAAAKSTIRIQCDGKDTALGVVVAADGFILTKASDLSGKITVKTREGIILEARIVGIHEGHDLAMLKVEAWGFVPIEWSDSKSARVGHFVVSCGPDPVPVAVGVVSVATRDVPPPKKIEPKGGAVAAAGYLGVYLDDSAKGAKITDIIPNTAAAKANLKVDDIILAVTDKAVKDTEELLQILGKHKPGDMVTLKVLRGSEQLDLPATLGQRPGFGGKGGKGGGKGLDQNSMGSKLSNRRTGFPIVLQHDSVVLPEDCGGPLVDLEGKVVGINIARAGRVESYAIPAETIRPLLADLMSGKLAPKKK
jgi:serine protease Do